MVKIESGRSMVEMLGVLAIIAILSIGAIAGYNMALNRYKANEIINTAYKIAVVVTTKVPANSSCINCGDDSKKGNFADIEMTGKTIAGNVTDMGVAYSDDPAMPGYLLCVDKTQITPAVADVIVSMIGKDYYEAQCDMSMTGKGSHVPSYLFVLPKDKE